MADMAQVLLRIAPDDEAVVRTAAALLVTVFLLKALAGAMGQMTRS
jgi:hypothetical protein